MKISSFQVAVTLWIRDCFGSEIADCKEERNYRFLEEALELAQSCGCEKKWAHMLVEYVYSRPVGEPYQEVGGVMVTLMALAQANGLSVEAAAEDEYARIRLPEVMARIRTKQATKPQRSPLPGHVPAWERSPLPLIGVIETPNVTLSKEALVSGTYEPIGGAVKDSIRFRAFIGALLSEANGDELTPDQQRLKDAFENLHSDEDRITIERFIEILDSAVFP